VRYTVRLSKFTPFDDVIIWWPTVWELIEPFGGVKEKCIAVGLFVAAHNLTLFARYVK